jgi:hypothetical protein
LQLFRTGDDCVATRKQACDTGIGKLAGVFFSRRVNRLQASFEEKVTKFSWLMTKWEGGNQNALRHDSFGLGLVAFMGW